MLNRAKEFNKKVVCISDNTVPCADSMEISLPLLSTFDRLDTRFLSGSGDSERTVNSIMTIKAYRTSLLTSEKLLLSTAV
jgi:hypothetical protein